MSSQKSPRNDQEQTVNVQSESEATGVVQNKFDGLEFPIPNQSTAAYLIGRLLNHFEWAAQLVLFRVSRDDKAAQLKRVLGKLIAIAYELQDQASFHAERFYSELNDDCEQYLSCEVVADDVLACLGDSPRIETHVAPGKVRRELVTSCVDPLLERLRQHLCPGFNEVEVWVLELGRALDQGVRPPDVYRYAATHPYISKGCYASSQCGEVANWVECGTVITCYQPGEVWPDSEWVDRLKVLMAKVGIPVVLFGDILASVSDEVAQGDQTSRFQIVEMLDGSIREHLSASIAAGRSTDGLLDPTAAGQGGNDAYVPASMLWQDQFETYKKAKAFLDRTPAIRKRSPRNNRLEIHAGDWIRHFDQKQKCAFDSLDVAPEAIQNVLETAARRKKQIRERRVQK